MKLAYLVNESNMSKLTPIILARIRSLHAFKHLHHTHVNCRRLQPSRTFMHYALVTTRLWDGTT